MWMLLRPEAANHSAESSRRGRWRLVRGGQEECRARVYLHPGRVLVAEIPAGEAARQFDEFRGALAYDSLGRAELAVDGRVGLLIDVDAPVLDEDGRCYPRAAFFLPKETLR
ncbi:MAG: hypothetical protein D6815_03000 [Candidatus Dadabacteria bacterium]|nr:MAG: hypothetical protein D6815_03000 [Candidatus Dadabacteria bacterium]